MPDQESFLPKRNLRSYATDGGMLWFAPRTGLHIYERNEQTAHLRRVAPRAVMFGITNACNLACTFCSRPAAAASQWTATSALETLRELSAAGTLEVAFGGGEPFAFRAFPWLLQALRAATPLAVHVTTNGELIDDEIASTVLGPHGCVDTVRLSLYNNRPWQRCAQRLQQAQQRYGVNILVGKHNLRDLAAMVETARGLGAKDVALLSYVGGDPAWQLDSDSRAELARLSTRLPLPVRISLCTGPLAAVPALFWGLDDDTHTTPHCQAGYDFLTITSDKQVRACSFHDRTFPFEDAEELLQIWRTAQEELATPATRMGCARTHNATRAPTPLTQLRRPHVAPQTPRVWHSESANNSGDCYLVAHFEQHETAQALVEELRPGLLAHHAEPQRMARNELPQAWLAIFEAARVKTAASTDSAVEHQIPSIENMVAIGNGLFISAYGLGFGMAELFAMAVARGGTVATTIHSHGNEQLVFALAANVPAAYWPQGWHAQPYGQYTLGHVTLEESAQTDSLAEVATVLHGTRAGTQVCVALAPVEVTAEAFTHALQRFSAHVAPARDAQPDGWEQMLFARHKTATATRKRLQGDGVTHWATRDRSSINAFAFEPCVILVPGALLNKRQRLLALRDGALAKRIVGPSATLEFSLTLEAPSAARKRKGRPKRQAETRGLGSAETPETQDAASGSPHQLVRTLSMLEPAMLRAALATELALAQVRVDDLQCTKSATRAHIWHCTYGSFTTADPLAAAATLERYTESLQRHAPQLRLRLGLSQPDALTYCVASLVASLRHR